jgi:hypothetical protein
MAIAMNIAPMAFAVMLVVTVLVHELLLLLFFENIPFCGLLL